jgi:methionine-rich copper-binding protein CopC
MNVRRLASHRGRHGGVLLLGLILLALTVAPAYAHAELVTAVPAPGATVSGTFSELVLTFSEPVAAGSEVLLFADAFQSIAGVSSSVSDKVITASLATSLAPGTYTVQWIAVSLDGHPVSGSYQFAIANPPPFAPWVMAWLAAGLLVVVIALVLTRRKARIDSRSAQ